MKNYYSIISKNFNLLLALIIIPFLGNAQTFVDQNATGTNNGSSWENAYTDLQDAIFNAPIGSEVWVAQGIYKPSSNGNIDTTFNLTKSIELYGGFNGTETSISKRDIDNNLTIISGDYNNNDNVVVSSNPLSISYNNYSDNSKRLIFAEDVLGSITIDGFTVSGGSNSSASAMYFSPDDSLSVVVKNCVIKNNKSGSVGAIFVTSGPFEKINFRLENSSLINNYTTSKGGAVFGGGSGETNIEYVNLLFHQNLSANRAGAVNHEGAVTPIFQNCIFSENRAANGGAIFELQSGQPKYINCTFYKNVANAQGSAIFNYSSPVTIIQNSIFYNNGSNSPLWGGGNFEIGNSNIEYTSWSNYASSGGSNSVDLGGNLYNINPQFIDEANYDFNLASSSPMIDAGDNTVLETIEDHTGYISRIVDNTVDLGAFEYHLAFNSTITSDNIVCFNSENGTASITADTYAPFTYLWNNTNIQGANPTNLSAGNYELTVKNAIGDFEVHTFSISAYPEIFTTDTFTYPSSGNIDGTATITVSGGLAPFTFEWNTSPIQTNETATDLDYGIYTVIVTDVNNCTKSVDIDLSNPTSIQSMNFSDDMIRIYPNPSKEKISIGSELIIESVLIRDITGKTLNIFIKPSNNTLDISMLTKGVYFLEIRANNRSVKKKFIKK